MEKEVNNKNEFIGYDNGRPIYKKQTNDYAYYALFTNGDAIFAYNGKLYKEDEDDIAINCANVKLSISKPELGQYIMSPGFYYKNPNYLTDLSYKSLNIGSTLVENYDENNLCLWFRYDNFSINSVKLNGKVLENKSLIYNEFKSDYIITINNKELVFEIDAQPINMVTFQYKCFINDKQIETPPSGIIFYNPGYNQLALQTGNQLSKDKTINSIVFDLRGIKSEYAVSEVTLYMNGTIYSNPSVWPGAEGDTYFTFSPDITVDSSTGTFDININIKAESLKLRQIHFETKFDDEVIDTPKVDIYYTDGSKSTYENGVGNVIVGKTITGIGFSPKEGPIKDFKPGTALINDSEYELKMGMGMEYPGMYTYNAGFIIDEASGASSYMGLVTVTESDKPFPISVNITTPEYTKYSWNKYIIDGVDIDIEQEDPISNSLSPFGQFNSTAELITGTKIDQITNQLSEYNHPNLIGGKAALTIGDYKIEQDINGSSMGYYYFYFVDLSISVESSETIIPVSLEITSPKE